MKQTAVEWLNEQMNNIKGSSINMNGRVQFIEKELNNLFKQAKEMEKQQSYTYDELRTIAYNAYCLGQLNEPTEGKYNLWIQQYKKEI